MKKFEDWTQDVDQRIKDIIAETYKTKFWTVMEILYKFEVASGKLRELITEMDKTENVDDPYMLSITNDALTSYIDAVSLMRVNFSDLTNRAIAANEYFMYNHVTGRLSDLNEKYIELRSLDKIKDIVKRGSDTIPTMKMSELETRSIPDTKPEKNTFQ